MLIFGNFVKASICVIIACGFLGMCSHSGSYSALGDRLIEYQLENNRYAVVVVLDGISESEAKKLAKKRAAEITVGAGQQYFTIDSMYETQVMQSEQGEDSQRFYGNMYQELIIERDFTRDRVQNRGFPITQTYQAIRLEFTTYEKKPSYKAIDACTLTPCNKDP